MIVITFILALVAAAVAAKVSRLALLAWLALTIPGIIAQLRANLSFTFECEEYIEIWINSPKLEVQL